MTSQPPVVWPADPRQFADPALCPACFTPLGGWRCPRCGFDPQTPEGRAVRDSALAVQAAERGRYEQVTRFHRAQAERRVQADAAAAARAQSYAAAQAAARPVAAPAAPVAQPVAPHPAPPAGRDAAAPAPGPAPASGPRRSGVQLFLMIAGLILLGIAALVFLVVAYSLTTVEGRVLITAGVAVGVLAVAALLQRRSVGGTAAGLTILAAAILAIAAVIAWSADAFTLRDVPLGLFLAVAGVVIGLLMSATMRWGRVRAAGVIAVLAYLAALGSAGGWVGALVFTGRFAGAEVFGSVLIGLALAGPAAAVRTLPPVETTLMRSAAFGTGILAVLRAVLLPSPNPVVDLVLLAVSGLLALATAMQTRRDAKPGWRTLFLAVAATALAVAPGLAVRGEGFAPVTAAAVTAISAAIVLAGIAVITARTADPQSTWWLRWLPAVAAAIVLAVPMFLLVPLALLRLVAILSSGAAPWRFVPGQLDVPGESALTSSGAAALTAEVIAQGIIAATALLLAGVVLFGAARAAGVRSPALPAVIGGIAVFAGAAFIPGVVSRGVLLLIAGAAGVALLRSARTSETLRAATVPLARTLIFGAAIILALSAPGAVALFIPSVAAALLLFAGAGWVSRPPFSAWPAALGGTLGLLWAAGWSVPFTVVVSGNAFAAPVVWHTALAVAAAGGAALVALVPAARVLRAETRRAAFFPGFAGAIAAAVVLLAAGERTPTAIVAFGLAAVAGLWFIVSPTRRVIETAVLLVPVPPALAVGIVQFGGGPVPWLIVSAVLLLLAVASLRIADPRRTVLQVSTGVVAVLAAGITLVLALPGEALIAAAAWAVTAIIPVVIARGRTPLFAGAVEPRPVRHLAWAGLPFAVGALLLFAFGTARTAPEAYSLPVAALLAALGLLIAWREPVAPATTPDGRAHRVGVLRTVLLVAALTIGIVPTLSFAGADGTVRILVVLVAGVVLLAGGELGPVIWRGVPLRTLLFGAGLFSVALAGIVHAGQSALGSGAVIAVPLSYAAAVVCAAIAVIGALRSTARMAVALAAAIAVVIAVWVAGGIGTIVEPWSLLVAVAIGACAVLCERLGTGLRIAGIALAVLSAVVPTAVAAMAGTGGSVRLIALLIASAVLLAVARPVPAVWRGLPASLLVHGTGAVAAVAAFVVAVATQPSLPAGPIAQPLAYLAFVLLVIAAVLAIGVADAAVFTIGAVAVVVAAVLWLAHPQLAVEPYTLVLGAGLLVRGLRRLATDPQARTMRALAPGLLVSLMPSLLYDYTGTALWRVVGLGVVAVAVLLWGLAAKWQAPFVIGGGVLILHALAQAWPWIIRLYEATTIWLWIAIGGALLVAIAATYEARIRNARAIARTVGSLR